MPYSPSLYMHELDRKATEALNCFPHFVKLQQAYLDNVDEKIAKIQLLSSAVRLSETQKSEIYALLPPICEKLGIQVPDFYMVQSRNKRDLNAFTGGINSPYLCVTSELLKQMSPEQIASVLAHECGHIACKHNLYHSMAKNLAQGINESPLATIPAIRRHLTEGLVKALLFWDRCSEFSADRAAVLCDGDSSRTVDVLLKVHGYDDSIDRAAFLKQALDLKSFVNESAANQLLEQMLVQWDSHPMLATRAYECCEWFRGEQCQGILSGTYTEETAKAEREKQNESEVLTTAFNVSGEENGGTQNTLHPEILLSALDQRINELNADIERYTVHNDKVVYAYAVSCGIITGWVDSIFFSDTALYGTDLAFSHRQVENFIRGYAKYCGIEKDDIKATIRALEQEFPVLQDNIWNGNVAEVVAKNHHLADLAHHPTPVGLLCSLMVQFLRVGVFVNKKGEWHFQFVETCTRDIVTIAVPAVITGVLNWLVAIAEHRYEEETGQELPKAIHRLAHIIASTPAIIEVAKCADNWFGHLVSDMGGSSSSKKEGMGIPGVFLSLLYEVAAIPLFKESGLTEVLNDLYQNQKIDLRHELAYGEQLKAQAIPVLFNEIVVRTGCMLLHLEKELLAHEGLKGINWRYVIPFANRTVDRMIAAASMTFNVVDTGDAALRAAIESGANWVIFAGRFVARYNYVGAGRAAVAIVREVSNEKREAQLIHERMILMDAKAELMFQQLQEFKGQLEKRVTAYLIEDLEAFLAGFEDIQAGLESNDSNLVIQGNVTIQRALGREAQFTTQDEFDDLMDSDEAFQF